MKITLAQLNPTVGDIIGNLEKIKKTIIENSKYSPDLIVFPELFLTGYPPRDLLERSWFINKVTLAINELVEFSNDYKNTGILFGAPTKNNKKTGRGLYNSALLIYQNQIISQQHKLLLPSYDVFDETRYFDAASKTNIIKFKNEALGISICEDAWKDSQLLPKSYYSVDPQEILAKKGASLLINISASPFHLGKEDIRFRIFQNHAKKHNIPIIFLNQIGGNDELIFDGRSMFIDKNGLLQTILLAFKEEVKTIDTQKAGEKHLSYKPIDKLESVYNALILGLRDYIVKCGFKKVIIGLSGGIDSALVCCLASDAIGNKNVLAVTMPGPFSSKGSVDDSVLLVKNLGIKLLKISINTIYESYIKTLQTEIDTDQLDTTIENIQARIRGNILMALSNKYGYLVLSTGNKSEIAMGYCTLYGDMTGGLSVISDIPKTMVYDLAKFINKKSEKIPMKIINKPPSAELRPNQKDQDTLPPYEILDGILYYYLNEGYSPQEIKNKFDPDIVDFVIKKVDKNEYKRRQASPGLKVTPKAFGIGRRMPIAAKYYY